MVLSLASTSGAGAAGAWSLIFSIQIHMNSWKKSFGVGAGAEAGAGVGADAGAGIRPGAGALGPRVGRLMAGFLRQTGDIVKSGERGVISLAFQIG